MRQATRTLLLAALAGALPLAAQADAGAGVRLSNFGWSLRDLDPNDGIAPNVTFIGADSWSNLRAETVLRGLDAGGQPLPYFRQVAREWSGQAWDDPFPTQSRSASLPTVQAQAAMGGHAAAGGYEVSVQARAANAAVQGVAYNAFLAFASPATSWQTFSMVLAPNTELVWTGQLNLYAEKTGRAQGLRHERARAEFDFSMVARDIDVQERYQAVANTFKQKAGRQSYEDMVVLSLRNDSANDLPAYMRMALTIEGITSMRPVPEPGTVGLMLAGVGVVGFVARRRVSPRPQGSAG